MNVITLNINKSLELLLSDKYIEEFQTIDGLYQHPQGLNFYDWLLKKKLISKDEHSRLIELLTIEGEQ